MFHQFTCVFILLVLATHTVVHASDAPIPNLQNSINAYLQDNSGDSQPMDAKDLAIMMQAARKLAKEMPNPGLQVGEKAPDFSLPNAYGKTVNLFTLLQQGPVIVTFYRGAWCPFCNLELRALQQSLPHFKRYGATLVAISPQLPDSSLRQLKATPLDFEILSDTDSSVMKAYRLHFNIPKALNSVYINNFQLDLADFNGDGRYELPIPGTIVIDQTGTVRAAFADTNYKMRMEPSAIIDALRNIRQ